MRTLKYQRTGEHARGSKFQGCLRCNCCRVWDNCETPSSFFLFFFNRFSIMAPNMFHIGVQEKVSITVFDAGRAVTVKLYLQDYPQRQKTFSQVQGRVENGNPVFSPPSTCFKFSIFQNAQSMSFI